MALKCKVCGKPDPKYFWRCEEHYHCDDCGTRDGLCTHTEGVLCDPCHEKRVEKRIAEFFEDTEHTDEVTCPWCGYECSDSWEISDGTRECGDCGREYDVERDMTVTYSTAKRHNPDIHAPNSTVKEQ